MDRNTILCYSCSEPALTVPKVIDGAQGQCRSCGLRGVVTVSDPDDGEGGCGLVAEFVTIEEAPYVCPGCYAVGPERCAPGCIDAEMEEDRELDRQRASQCECGWCNDCNRDGWDEEAAE